MAPLSRETILDTAELILRKYGTEKTTVLDVAKELNISHGTIYRHFPSKASLKEAVAERWLKRVSAPLVALTQGIYHPTEALRNWFDTLILTKRTKMKEDPELFQMYTVLTEEAVELVSEHIDELISQVTVIVEAGMSAGEFKAGDAKKTAAAIFFATARFHHPVLSNLWLLPTIEEEFEAVWGLLMTGLKSE